MQASPEERPDRKTLRVGLISDTHGLLRPQAVEALRGADHILHAGDLGDPRILEALRALAPVTAVRGNTDRAPDLPLRQLVELGGLSFYLLHDLAHLDLEPRAAGVSVVVSGHSHKPLLEERGGVLWANPGSAGPRRFQLPVTVALLRISGGRVAGELVYLEP